MKIYVVNCMIQTCTESLDDEIGFFFYFFSHSFVGSDVLEKVKFLDDSLVPRTKFLSQAREKASTKYHKHYLQHMIMSTVTELTGSPRISAWLCLKLFEYFVKLNYPVNE